MEESIHSVSSSTLSSSLCTTSSSVVLIIIIIIIIWKAIELFWLKPKRIEKWLRNQGLKGNRYKPFIGDAMEILTLTKQSPSDDDNFSGITAFFHRSIQKHGKICFAWIGPLPCLIITAPELMKEILTKHEDFQKPDHPFIRLLMVGLFGHEGQKWAYHRKIINPAFHLEKLKNMLHAMYLSCRKMTSDWEEIVAKKGLAELDVWPFLESLTGDVISRTAFGSSYEEGRRIFDLLREHISLMMGSQATNYIPGWRFLPTRVNRRVKEICKEVEAILTEMIDLRKRELEEGGSPKADLLGILLESNMKEIKEHGNEKGRGLTTEDVVQECKLFYLAGQETTASLLVWTLILLSKHQAWQDRARAEVFQVFGKHQQPDFEGLSRLKIVTMILYEALRLHAPVYTMMRKVYKDIKLGKWLIPKGTEVFLPISSAHQDCDLWGSDAKEFNPERFCEGVSKATKGQGAFLPFSSGPRICVGQNFALLEAKLAVTMILQLFSLELSPTYVHAPEPSLTMKPRYGANLILREL